MTIEYYSPMNESYITDISQDGDVALKCIKGIFKIRLNGICEIELTIPYDKEERWKLIQKGGVIKSPTPYSEAQLFPISKIKRGMQGLNIKAMHIFFDLSKSTTEDIRADKKNCKQALDILLNGTKYTGHSNINSISSCYFIENNRVAFINGNNENTIIKRWGGEIHLDNYNIHVNQRIGDDYGVEINYGVSLLDIGLNEDYVGIITRGKPKAFNGRRLPELYVDSPLINNYRIIYEDFIDMGDLKLKEDSQDGEGFETEEELYAAMRLRMKELYESGADKPSLSGAVKVAPLENTEKYKYVKGLVNIGLGDTVHVNHKNIGTDIQIRCIGYDWNILTKKYEDVIVGDESNNYFNTSTDTKSRVDNILNNNGTVNAVEIMGILNAVNVQMKAMRDIAQSVPVRAMICEDLIKDSPTYGAMCWGTMGFMIASERTIDNKDWNWRTFGTGKGFFADLIVAGTMLADRIRGGILESIDGSLQIDLRDTSMGVQFKKNGLKAISINGNQLDFFDWDGLGESIAKIYSTRFSGDEFKTGIALVNKKNSAISIGYQIDDGTYLNYVTFDKDNILHDYPVQFYEAVKFTESVNFTEGISTYEIYSPINKENKIYSAQANNESAWAISKGLAVMENLYVYGEVKMLKAKTIDDPSDRSNSLFASSGKWVSSKDFHANGNFTVSGSKNCVQKTENYGDRLYYATEDAEPLLTDTGKSITKEFNGSYEAVVMIDNIYKESVDLSEYYVFLTKYDRGDIWIKEQTENYFIIESENPIKFNWKIEGKRIGFENKRLEEYTNIEAEDKIEEEREVFDIVKDVTKDS